MSLAATVAAGTFGTSAAAPCTEAAAAAGWSAPEIYAGEVALTLEELSASLAGYRAVLIGERHDSLDHHLNQLEVICSLAGSGPISSQFAVGLEAFQQSFQAVLDDYVSGRIGEAEMLERSEYFDRWRFDFRLYAPILRFARERGLKLVALNVPSELVSKVGRLGLDGLDPAERAGLPDDMPAADAAYRERLRVVFDAHAMDSGASFEHFVQAQVAWDEGMAKRAADYLVDEAAGRIVVIAGGGHIAYRSGIADRLARRAGIDVVTITQGDGEPPHPDSADFRLFQPSPVELATAGAMGVRLNTKGGRVEVSAFADSSAAREAGLVIGDRLVGIGARDVDSYSDVRVAMLGKLPGERVKLRVARKGVARALDIELTLR